MILFNLVVDNNFGFITFIYGLCQDFLRFQADSFDSILILNSFVPRLFSTETRNLPPLLFCLFVSFCV